MDVAHATPLFTRFTCSCVALRYTPQSEKMLIALKNAVAAGEGCINVPRLGTADISSPEELKLSAPRIIAIMPATSVPSAMVGTAMFIDPAQYRLNEPSPPPAALPINTIIVLKNTISSKVMPANTNPMIRVDGFGL